jgi:hypothetical protein
VKKYVYILTLNRGAYGGYATTVDWIEAEPQDSRFDLIAKIFDKHEVKGNVSISYFYLAPSDLKTDDPIGTLMENPGMLDR